MSMPALKSVREDWGVPGTCSVFPLFPALKRRAILKRPCGAGLSCASFHRIARKRVLTHTLKGHLLSRLRTSRDADTICALACSRTDHGEEEKRSHREVGSDKNQLTSQSQEPKANR